MRDITYDVHIDWNGDGDFGDPNEDVSADVQRPITLRYGRDQARASAPPAAGRAEFDLKNQAGKYSPENTSSPLFGNLLPGRRVRIQAEHDSTAYNLFQGFIDDFQVTPAIGLPRVSLTALDGLARFRGVRISTGVLEAVQTGAVIDRILDEIGWPTADRDLDRGVTTIRWWWEEDTDALEALERVLNSEGPPAMLTVSGDGKVVFRDRHHRLTRAASLTSQATFSESGGTEPVHARPLRYDIGWRDVVNRISIEVEERRPTGERVNVFETEQNYTIPNGETVVIGARGNDPFIRALAPVAGTDFELVSGTVQVTLDRTSGASANITIRAVGGTAKITGMKLRAYALASTPYKVEVSDPASITSYGPRSSPHDAPWCGVHDALAVGEAVLAHRSVRLPVVQMRLQGSEDARILQQLSRDLSDRITIVEPSISLNHQFYIDLIEHTISGDGKLHETTFGCEMVPPKPAVPFTFGVSGRGFGQGAFDVRGLDNPSTMFRFDTSGQGFGDGRFAT
jgi:hypothetical protein